MQIADHVDTHQIEKGVRLQNIRYISQQVFMTVAEDFFELEHKQSEESKWEIQESYKSE